LTARVCGCGGRGRTLKQLDRFGRAEVIEGLQRGGEELAQCRAQSQHVALPVPNQTLMRPRDDLDGFGKVAVSGQRSVPIAVQPNQVSQNVRVTTVALRP